jgi:hypothetical protein
MLEGRLGFGKHLSKVFDFGVTAPVSWGYFFKSGAGLAANDEMTHYQAIKVDLMLFLRVNLRFI